MLSVTVTSSPQGSAVVNEVGNASVLGRLSGTASADV